MNDLVLIALALAGVPAMIGLSNLLLLASPQGRVPDKSLISILIRAHSAEDDIEACLAHALGQIGVATEVIVLDDGSQDHTAELLATLAARDGRIRVLPPSPAPQHLIDARTRLALAARGTHFLFLDASVRLDPHAAAALAGQAARMNAGMVSGAPRQLLRSAGAALTLPVGTMLAAAFLPGGGRALSRLPILAAVSEDMLLVTRAAYLRAGGHPPVRAAERCGLALARRMRAQGLRTDMVDAAGLATRRCGGSLRVAWAAFARQPGGALPGWWLAAAHLLPLALLPAAGAVQALLLLAALRIGAAVRAREAWWAVPLHPFAMAVLCAALCAAPVRAVMGRASPRRGSTGPVAGPAG